jgi:hypothetical protein
MAENDNNRLLGSITQRSFIPRELGVVLNVATIPISELGCKPKQADKPDFLRTLTAHITGVPSDSILDDKQYQQLTELARNENLLRLLARPRHLFFYEMWYEYYEILSRELSKKTEIEVSDLERFAKDSLALFVSPQSHYLTGSPWIFPYYPFLPEEQNNLKKAGLDFPSETLQLGFSCLLAGIQTEERVVRLTSALEEYHIPFGQSPKTESDSLLKLIQTGKKMCLAPMAAAGAIGVTQLTQGAYIAAILTVGTGSTMSLILIGALSVGDLIVRYLRSKQPNDSSQ